MIDLVLKKSKERSLLRRHPWVYDTAVQKVVLDSKKTAPASGETVRVVSFDGRFSLGQPIRPNRLSAHAAGPSRKRR